MSSFKAFHNSLQAKNILFKLLLSFAVPTVMLVFIIALFFSYWFSKEGMADVNANTRLALSNVGTIFSNAVESSKTTAYQVYNNPNIKALLFSPRFSKEDFLHASRYLGYILLADEKIYSIYIYNGNKTVVDHGGDYDFKESDTEISELAKKIPVLKPVPRQIQNKRGEYINVITIAYHEWSSDDDSIAPAVIVNLKADSLYRMLRNKFLVPEQSILIANAAGDVLVHSNMEMFSKTIPLESYYTPSIIPLPDYGSMETEVDGKPSIVNYISIDDGKFLVFLISDTAHFFSKIMRIRNIILFSCLSIFLVMIAVMVFLSYRVYTPINTVFLNIRKLLGTPAESEKGDTEIRYISGALGSVIERLNYLENDHAHSVNILRSNFLHQLFMTQEAMTQEAFMDNLGKHGISITADGTCRIIVLKVSGWLMFLDGNSSESVRFQLGSIENIVCDSLRELGNCKSLSAEASHVILLAESNSTLEELSALLQKVQDTIYQLFNLELITGISDPLSCLSVEQMRNSYQQALNLTCYSLVYGKRTILHSGTVRICEDKNDKIAYFTDSVVGAVKSGSLEQYTRYLGMFFSSVCHYSYERIVKYLFYLTQAILQIPKDLQLESFSQSEEDIDVLYKQIRSFEEYAELEQWLIRLFTKIAEDMTALKSRKNQDMMDSVKNYIAENYADSMLSANLLAERIHVSPQYFSKLFKEYAGMSFPDYLSHIRLESARAILLSNPNISITEICEKTGYNSRTYFATSFTKKYGLPPSKYLQLKREE